MAFLSISSIYVDDVESAKGICQNLPFTTTATATATATAIIISSTKLVPAGRPFSYTDRCDVMSDRKKSCNSRSVMSLSTSEKHRCFCQGGRVWKCRFFIDH